MPRKENGFGKTNSFEFKPFKDLGRVDKGKGKGAAGLYPSNRQYGSSVNRSVIEKWNLDSDWVKWRKGYEYYNRAAWYQLEDYDALSQEYEQSRIKSVLYQGTPNEVDVEFTGYKFATKNADSNNHYVVKRTCTSEPDLGEIIQVKNDPLEYPNNKAAREIWCKGSPGADARLLLRMIGERITDGETEASLTYVLDNEDKPALYVGKSFNELTNIKVIIPINSILLNENVTIDNYTDLVGQVAYIPNFYVEKPIEQIENVNWIDGIDHFGIELTDTNEGASVWVLDAKSEAFPPSLYDIKTLPELLSSEECTYLINGTYIYQKNLYQRFFGRQYLTSDVVKERIEAASYSIMPFTILGVGIVEGNLEMTAVPAITTVELYAPLGDSGTLIFTDYSFTKSRLGTEEEPWLYIDTDVDPWMDEVFSSGNPLRPATLYSCSCPNYSHAILSSPQQSEEDGERKINRQRRYPLPTVLGQGDFNALGKNQAAGKLESWESREHRMSYKLCKHAIAAMFIEHKQVIEPSQYPTVEARINFEEKLKKEMDDVGAKFEASYKRGGITTLEVIFALAQGLNLDDVELAYVILNSKF